MKIVLSGIESNNKGAELMLYAILQEIERKYPNAEVYLPVFSVKQGLNYIQTSLKLKDKPLAPFIRFMQKFRFWGILRRFGLPVHLYLDARTVKGANYFIDASGFTFSDQWKHSQQFVEFWEKQLKGYKQERAKIIFLPQAFGPIELPVTKSLLGLLNQYANLIMPREKVSLNYLLHANMNKEKIQMYTDFTSLVKGIFPKQYTHLKNGVCIIPNMRMIDKGVISFENYLNLLNEIIKRVTEKGHVAYLLNHEGIQDEQLAFQCKEKLNGKIEVVSGLNALEVKGLIASSYLCISSRFHGVASALNSAVPCLATSWSHKYEELFKDYDMNDCVLDLSNVENSLTKIEEYLSEGINKQIKEKIKHQIPSINNETQKMWENIWS